jgi:hypothetical protein
MNEKDSNYNKPFSLEKEKLKRIIRIFDHEKV